MGGGILPISFKDGKIYFLFSRESGGKKYKDGGLWSDFGGSKRKMRHFYKQLYVKVGKKAMVY